MRTLSSLLLASCIACSGAPASRPADPPASPSDPGALAPGEPVVTVRGLFCTYGGVGLVPVPTPADFESVFVSQVFEIDNPGPPLSGVTLVGASLRDDAGVEVASLRRLDHFVDLSADPPPDPSWGSFAVHLNGTGTPFDGTLRTGTTRLRIRYAATEAAASVASCRAELAGLGVPTTIDTALSGVLPSS